MSLDHAIGVVREDSSLSGRTCTTADVDGLRRGEDVTFRLWVDRETGIVLRTERLDGKGSLEVQDLRVGRIGVGTDA
jgi:negative regulator of sigma E activity